MKNSKPIYLLIRATLFLLSIILYPSSFLYSQITITQSQVMDIFTPGNPLYFIPGESGPINIGNTGGPNNYDFSYVDLNSPHTFFNYEVSQIPILASRYPAGATIFGESPQHIVWSPVFYSSGDSILVPGSATIDDHYRFSHHSPFNLFAGFPLSYPVSFWQTSATHDSTFDLSWQLLETNFYSGSITSTVDGYGTIQLPDYDLECLRMKNEYSWSEYKDFIYFTREGFLIITSDISVSEPDTGFVTGYFQIGMSEGFVGVENDAIRPTDFELSQNYPNPFNAQTTIQYSLSEPSDVTIEIYDILGRRVETLVNEEKQAGQHQIFWDATNHSSSIYFYRLQAGAVVETKRMVLIK